MINLEQFSIQAFNERMIVGLATETSFSDAGSAWSQVKNQNLKMLLSPFSTQSYCDDIEENIGIGVMVNFRDQNHFKLIIGDFFAANTRVPQKLDSFSLPTCSIAKFKFSGNSLDEIIPFAFEHMSDTIQNNGLEIDFENFFWIEIYPVVQQYKNYQAAINYMIPIIGKQF